MAKSEEEVLKDTFERLVRQKEVAAGKLHGTNGDGREKEYATAYQAMYRFGTEHGFTNQIKLRRKYKKS